MHKLYEIIITKFHFYIHAPIKSHHNHINTFISITIKSNENVHMVDP